MKKAVVIGAGFSGMCAAYYLNRAGYHVEIFEKEKSPGGLIRTVNTPHGSCEIAANGILNSVLFEEMAKEINLNLRGALKSSRKRFIYRGSPRRWPLSFFESVVLIWKYLTCRSRALREYESIAEWGNRVLGPKATQYILSPVLQGIYAGDIKKLSASLILKLFFKKTKKVNPLLKGIVAPEFGMSQFFNKMEEYLKNRGVLIVYERDIDLSYRENGIITVIATSAHACAQILKSVSEPLSKFFSSIDMISLIKATLFYPDPPKKFKGFGMLFPSGEGVRSLGVLFDNFIFSAQYNSESYILGGALDPGVMALSDRDLVNVITEDRARALKEGSRHLGLHIQRWHGVLPHYTVELEKDLKSLESEKTTLEKSGIFIIGNYLGGIGLSQLLEQASGLPLQIAASFKNV